MALFVNFNDFIFTKFNELLLIDELLIIPDKYALFLK